MCRAVDRRRNMQRKSRKRLQRFGYQRSLTVLIVRNEQTKCPSPGDNGNCDAALCENYFSCWLRQPEPGVGPVDDECDLVSRNFRHGARLGDAQFGPFPECCPIFVGQPPIPSRRPAGLRRARRPTGGDDRRQRLVEQCPERGTAVRLAGACPAVPRTSGRSVSLATDPRVRVRPCYLHGRSRAGCGWRRSFLPFVLPLSLAKSANPNPHRPRPPGTLPRQGV